MTLVILIMIIHRPKETTRIKQIKKWVLVYGRRKTGKTFLIEKFVPYDDYFFVKRDRTIFSKNKRISYEAFLEILERGLEEGRTIVIDEFHRFGDDFLDFLQYIKKQGKVILVSSTLHLSKQFFSAHSPILGFFAEVPIGIIDLADCIKELKVRIKDKKRLVETAILSREPIAIEEIADEPRTAFAKMLLSSINTIPSLIGEIFIEEERTLSAVYEGILRAIADGKVVSSEISSYLFSAKLIEKDSPSLIQQHLNNLIKFGLIKRIGVYNKNKFVYKHISPLIRLFYYADEKYNISERKLQLSEKEIGRIIAEIMPKSVEDSIREFFSNKFGLAEMVFEAKDYEADGILLKFKKPEVALEVKWKEKINEDELFKAEKTLSQINAKKKFLFVPDKTRIKQKQKFTFEIVDISDFI